MGKSVVVGCKLPHGIILQLEEFPDVRVELRGANSSDIVDVTGHRQRGTCGYTPGVDEDFISKWLVLYAKTPMVAKELIFVQNTLRNAQAQGEEMKDETTGLEPIDPSKSLLKNVEVATDKANPDAGEE